MLIRIEEHKSEMDSSLQTFFFFVRILKALLNELIDRSVEKKHPKLMLRRTESVVEKFLTNWLSICMYAHIKVRTTSGVCMSSSFFWGVFDCTANFGLSFHPPETD